MQRNDLIFTLMKRQSQEKKVTNWSPQRWRRCRIFRASPWASSKLVKVGNKSSSLWANESDSVGLLLEQKGESNKNTEKIKVITKASFWYPNQSRHATMKAAKVKLVVQPGSFSYMWYVKGLSDIFQEPDLL